MTGVKSSLLWTLGKMKAIGGICLLGMTFLTCADIVGRFFGHPVFGSVELVRFMATLSVAMALPYTHKVEGHIGVEILVRLFKPRIQNYIDLVTHILSMLLAGLITWRMFLYAHTMKQSGTVSMNLELPEYVVIYVVAFCFVVFTGVIINNIFEIVGRLRES
jgi:TRAP-type C4-dicarboxylate transport system permease small subunit